MNIRYFITAIVLMGSLVCCEKPQTSPDGDDSDGKEEPVTPDKPKPETYKVGDFYSKGIVKGIVVSTDETGEHGSVVSLGETEDVWSYAAEEAMASQPRDGKYNSGCVWSMPSWQDNYPGFKWCSDMNVMSLRKWYVPSVDELFLLYTAYTGRLPEPDGGDDDALSDGADALADDADVRDGFNARLTDAGGVPIADAVYWTSDEAGAGIAYAVDMRSGEVVMTPNDLDKKKKWRFRAMADF